LVERKTPSERVREALGRAGRRPLEHLSQNFLIDPNILRLTLDAAEVTAGRRVLEIGPGPGVLTAELLHAGARVTAVELDRDLAAYLRAEFAGEPLALIEDDVLNVDMPSALSGSDDWLVVANLPYAISSPCLRLLYDLWPKIERAIVMVQKEVAERVCAGAGGKLRSTLSVFVQRRYRASVVRVVPPTAFHPRPEVRSALLRLERIAPGSPEAERAPDGDFTQLVRAAFGQRRKMLRKSLPSGPDALPREWVARLVAAAGLEGTERAEDVPGCAFEEMACTLSHLRDEGR